MNQAFINSYRNLIKYLKKLFYNKIFHKKLISLQVCNVSTCPTANQITSYFEGKFLTHHDVSTAIKSIHKSLSNLVIHMSESEIIAIKFAVQIISNSC
jgi:hypothetical protein